ncbi:hypothetical protein K1719_004662 [Acacia pycnantha]|nr:hypothetical protein K1719_004662 [Acacia pycnantha]
MNEALLGRVAWNLISKPNNLCSLVLSGKYKKKCNFLECCKTDSELWRKLTQLWPSIVENIYWDIGDGNEVKFWEDKWVEDKGSLARKCLGQLSEEVKRVTVSEMLNERGEWDMERLQGSLNEEG